MTDRRFEADTLFLCFEEDFRFGPPAADDEIDATVPVQLAGDAGAGRGDGASPKARRGLAPGGGGGSS